MNSEMNNRSEGITRSNVPDHENLPRGWRWLAKLLILFLRSRNQWRTWNVERKRLPILDGTIKIFRDGLERCRKLGLADADRIYNVGLYLLLADRDCAVLKVQMISSFENWNLRFTARQIALLVYEVCDDLIGLLGKQFRQSLITLSATEDDMNKFNKIYQQLTKFTNTNHQFLYNDIRNLVAGHRSQDSLEFLPAVEAIDPLRVFRLGGDFFEIVHALIHFLTETLVRMAHPQIALKQLLASPKFIRSLEQNK
jgi:hypothetical protein